jgi:hypothetical protein
MADDKLAFNPTEIYLDLHDGGAAEIIPMTPELWPAVMAGAREIRGRLAGASRLTRDLDRWEMHPAGDEWLIRLSGVFEVVLEMGGTTRRAMLNAETCCCLVPKGAWHTIRVRERGDLLFVTPGAGTEHRPI